MAEISWLVALSLGSLLLDFFVTNPQIAIGIPRYVHWPLLKGKDTMFSHGQNPL